MRITLKNLLIIITLILSSATFAKNTASYQEGKYAIDPAHTRASFVVPHFVISEVEGRFNEVKGEFTLDKNFTKSKLTATIPVSSIDTGVKQRDDHLKSKDFFEVSKFPDMQLVSKSITGKPEDFKMTTALTIKGVTKNVVFDGKYTGSVDDPWGKHRAAFQATAKINRKDFNINYDDKIDVGPVVGNEVTIRLWTEGIKEAKAAKKETKKKK